jgi:hypothetical protein
VEVPITHLLARVVDGVATAVAARWCIRQSRPRLGGPMIRYIRTAGQRFGRAVRNASRRYLEMMATCDVYGYYGF